MTDRDNDFKGFGKSLIYSLRKSFYYVQLHGTSKGTMVHFKNCLQNSAFYAKLLGCMED